MAPLPPYLANKRRGGAAGTSEPRKRAASEGACSERAPPQAPSAKKSKSSSRSDPTPSAVLGALPPRSDKETGGVRSSPAGPQLRAAQATPRPPTDMLPRGLIWENGVTDQLSVAFLPPRRFHDVAVPFNDADECLVKSIQDNLLKGAGLTQSLLHLKHQSVIVSAERRRLEKEKDAALAANQKLEAELLEARALAGKAAEDLAAAQAQASKDVAAAQAQASKDVAAVKDELAQANSLLSSEKAAHVSAMEAVKTLQSQRCKLCEDLSETQKLLAANMEAVDRTAKDAFDMTLAQVRHWNPEVDLSRCHYLAYVADGQFFPAEDDASTLVPAEDAATPGPDAPSQEDAAKGDVEADAVDHPAPPPSES